MKKLVYDIIDDIHELNFEEFAEKYKNLFRAAEIKESINIITQMEREKNYFSILRPTISSRISSVEQVKSTLQSGLRQVIWSKYDLSI